MGHGLDLAAQPYAERDGLKGAALRPAGGGIHRGDGRAVVDVFRGVGADDDSLQLAGDGLIAAVMQRVDGAAELARGLVVGLRQRGWEGDDELADQLEAQVGGGPAAMLRALPVDLDELAGILEGDPLSVGGRIEITTGQVWSQAAIEYALETGEKDEDTSADPERWLAVHGEGSREDYQDTELYIASVEDPGRAERLAIAIKGRGAFRRFKAIAFVPSGIAGPASLSDGTHSPRSASAPARDHGSRRPATAYCRSTTAIPENGPPARYQPERGTSPSRAEGRQTHARARGRGYPSIALFHRASRDLRAQRRHSASWPRATPTSTRRSLPRWAARRRRGR